MNEAYKNTKYVFILLILSYFFFMFGNGIISLTIPDEVFYAQTAKEMARHTSWTTPYLFNSPNFEKPIFLYWLLRIGFILFGISSFSARFFPVLFASFGVVAVYCLGLLGFNDSRKAFYSALVLMSSGLYIGLARTVFTDMVFSTWILLALLSFFWGYMKNELKGISIILFFVCAAFAALTKGPLGLAIPVLIVILFLWFRHEVKYLWCTYAIWGALVFITIALPWYMYMVIKYKDAFMHEFFYNERIRRFLEAEHKSNDTWYFYPLSMIGCMFPWSLFVPVSLFLLMRKHFFEKKPFYFLLACWIGVVFIIFQFAHSKLASYISPLLPALALLIGNYIYESAVMKKGMTLTVLFILAAGMLFLLSISLLVGIMVFPEYITVKTPIYFLVFLLLCLSLLILRFNLCGKYFKCIAIMVLIVPIVLLTVPFIKKDIEPYISSSAVGEFLVRNTAVNSVILCSKPFVRGVRYYTDRKVAVMSGHDDNFFSPHPIPVLDSDEKVSDFLHFQSITYCVLKKSSLEDLYRMARFDGFKIDVLNVIGNQYVCIVRDTWYF